MSAKVRYGMVGGGEGAFIGGVHRIAAGIAGNWELTAGAFSSTPDKARRSAAAIGVARGYDSWEHMLAEETALPVDRRIQVVSIVTPNFLHAPVAIAAMQVSALVYTASFFAISIACDYRYLYALDLAAVTGWFYLALDWHWPERQLRAFLRGR